MTILLRRKKRRRATFIILCLLALAVLWQEVAFRLNDPAVYSSGHNAMWIRHSWVGEKHGAQEYSRLADLLKKMEITDAYFHVGPLREDGTVDPERCQYAEDLLKQMSVLCPEVRSQAWLGQVSSDGDGPLDISIAEIRSAIVDTADGFLKSGFEGIHYDIEPVYSGNTAFLELLRETRRLARSHNAVLSVAACKPEPFPGVEWAARRVARNPGYWTRGYFLRVAGCVDQVAVMTYDSAIPLPSLYGRMISSTVRWSARQGVEDLLIGVPVYDDWTASHSPCVENLRNSLAGLKQGAAHLTSEQREHVGAAIYPEWMLSESERQEFTRSWIGKSTND